MLSWKSMKTPFRFYGQTRVNKRISNLYNVNFRFFGESMAIAGQSVDAAKFGAMTTKFKGEKSQLGCLPTCQRRS
jgi:hypothetical protein